MSHLPLYQAIVGAAIILTGAGFWLRLRPTYLVYAVVSLLFYLAWGTLEGLPRYVGIIFPLHLVLALLSSRWKWLYDRSWRFPSRYLRFAPSSSRPLTK